MRTIAALVSLLLLSACSLSPERMAQVDEVVAGERGSIEIRPDVEPVATDSELNRLGLEDDQHHVLLIDQGADALAARIHLIRAATERIELMNYLFYFDEIGEVLLGELVDAARRGVAVRILVDSLFSLKDHQLLAGLELAHRNIEVRLYNPPFNRASPGKGVLLGGLACCFRSVNHRLHHKLLAVDERHALIGGRNTGARYFDLDTRMNFLDMEVLITGSTVREMAADFDHFWRHDHSKPARHTREVAGRLLDDPPEALVLERSGRAAFGARMAADGSWLVDLLDEAGFVVGDIAYFSDPPGKIRRGEESVSTRRLHDLMRRAKRRILIQTPYLVLSRKFESTLAGLDDDIEVTVSTNSLAATDAFPVYAISRRQRFRMVEQLGLRIHEIKPFPADLERLVSRYPQLVADKAAGIEMPTPGDPAPATRPMPGPRVSVHAKLMVIDDETVVVTSHNFDPRSERYNTENGIVVRDTALAGAVTDYIEMIAAPGNSWVVRAKPDGPPVIGPINRGMAKISRRLPTLDLWPWYLTENYRQDAGGQSAGSGHEFGSDAGEPVGLAPEAVRGPRRFMTTLVSRMFGFLRPIM